MYGKNTLDKIYLTQKKLLPHPSTYQRKGKNSHPSPILLLSQRGNSSFFQGRIAIPSEVKGRIAIRPYYSLTPAPRSPLTDPCSLFPVPCSLTPVLCSLLTDPCSLFYVKNLL